MSSDGGRAEGVLWDLIYKGTDLKGSHFLLPSPSELRVLSHVQLFGTPWTVAHQAPLSMGFSQARILERVAISSSNFWS